MEHLGARGAKTREPTADEGSAHRPPMQSRVPRKSQNRKLASNAGHRTRESRPRAIPGTCAATERLQRGAPFGSGTAWRSVAGICAAGRPSPRRRPERTAASRAWPNPTAAAGCSSRRLACAGSRGGGRVTPRLIPAARARTCAPGVTRGCGRLRGRRRSWRSRGGTLGRSPSERGVRWRGGAAPNARRSFGSSANARRKRRSRNGRRRLYTCPGGSAGTYSCWCRRWRGRGSITSRERSTQFSTRRVRVSTASRG